MKGMKKKVNMFFYYFSGFAEGVKLSAMQMTLTLGVHF